MSFLCIAHRGAMGYEPENTVLSIKKAIELGAKWVEIDVHYIDGELIVRHDPIIRTEYGDINIYDATIDKIKEIDLGNGANIPTLEEILCVSEGKIKINIELKGIGTSEPTMNLVSSYIKSKKYKENDFIISSFIFDELKTSRIMMDGLRIGVLTEDNIDESINIGKEIDAYSINISIDIANKMAIKSIHNEGFKAFVYTANTEDEIYKMIEYGADGVFTNYIDICNRCAELER